MLKQLQATAPECGSSSRLRLSARFATYCLWGGWVGLAFFSIYPTLNWITSLRAEQFLPFFAWELALPFVPQMVWFYLSMYFLFLWPPFFLPPESLRRLAKELILATVLAGILFLLFPCRLAYVRVLPEDEFYRALFSALFAVDKPYNLVPSLHVVYSTAIILSIAKPLRLIPRLLLFIWLSLIALATLLVHQHHLLDVVSGFALALGLNLYWKTGKIENVS